MTFSSPLPVLNVSRKVRSLQCYLLPFAVLAAFAARSTLAFGPNGCRPLPPRLSLYSTKSDREPGCSSEMETEANIISQDRFVANQLKSVNYFISRECNYKCKFCFHTQKNVDKLALEEAKLGLKMLKDAGTEKVRHSYC